MYFVMVFKGYTKKVPIVFMLRSTFILSLICKLLR